MAKTAQEIYAIQERSSFDRSIVPYTLITAKTRELARVWIEAHIWTYTHNTWDMWDEIDPSELDHEPENFGSIVDWEDSVMLKRRKTGEIIIIYIDRLYLLIK